MSRIGDAGNDLFLGGGQGHCQKINLIKIVRLKMINNKFIRISQSGEKNRIIQFTVGNEAYEIDSGFEYADAYVFPEKKIVFVIHFLSSKDSAYVGAIFNFSGEKICDVPFPQFDYRYAHLTCSYSWATVAEDTLKIFFGTDSVMYGDFWIDYDLDKYMYSASGRAR